MTRPLLIVTALAFLTCIVCFGVVSALGGLKFSSSDWWIDFDDDGVASDGGGPQVSRTIAWPGGDSLQVNVGAEIDYVQGPDAKLVVTGPKRAVDALELDGDRLGYDRRVRSWPRLKITMTAPDVTDFTLHGSQRLNITGFDHDRLEVAVHGSGKVKAAGKAHSLDLKIFGSGDADFEGLSTDDAEVKIAGSGDAVVAPKERVDVSIAGSGDVTLTTQPHDVSNKIMGSGRIIRREPTTPVPAEKPAENKV